MKVQLSWSERLLDMQEVVGSNPTIFTKQKHRPSWPVFLFAEIAVHLSQARDKGESCWYTFAARRSTSSLVRRRARESCEIERKRYLWEYPTIFTKKEVTFVYQKLLLFLSKPQAWHIITTQSCISSAPLGLYLITRQRASSCGLMRCNTAC